MRENISPEEKLLRLIRGEKKGVAPVGTPAVPVAGGKKPDLQFKLPVFLRKIDQRKAMLVLLGLSCLYLLFSFIYPFIFLRKVGLPDISKEKGPTVDIGAKSEGKPLEEYLQGISGKQIFSSVPSAGVAGPASGVSADLVKDINLVGIITGDNPQAIIEDKKAQKTYYLNKGQYIGEFLVEDIQEGKIILNFNGQRFELHL